MNILVTGAAGFIGSHFVEYLLSASRMHTPRMASRMRTPRMASRMHTPRIVGIDNFCDSYDPALKRRNVAGFINHPCVTLIEHDFCDADFVQALFKENRFTHIVHLGGLAGVRDSVDQTESYLRNNVEGSRILLDAADQYSSDRLERFVLMSSSTVYGVDAVVPFCETALLGDPASPYGMTKRLAETLAMTKHNQCGMPVTCLRPFSVYGARMRPDLALSRFTGFLLRGESLPLNGDGSYQRDMTHVSDICRGVYAAMMRPTAIGHCINLGCGRPISMLKLISSLSEAVGRAADIAFLPASKADLATTWADLTLARRVLGFTPRISFESGAMAFVEWYRSEVIGKRDALVRR